MYMEGGRGEGTVSWGERFEYVDGGNTSENYMNVMVKGD